MPSEETQFKGKGLGITNRSPSRGAKFPPEIDAILVKIKEDGGSISNYIRDAVREKMERGGLI